MELTQYKSYHINVQKNQDFAGMKAAVGAMFIVNLREEANLMVRIIKTKF